jgi:hypothetical protein
MNQNCGLPTNPNIFSVKKSNPICFYNQEQITVQFTIPAEIFRQNKLSAYKYPHQN